MSVTFVYKDDFDGLVRHIVNPKEHDATECEELIDARDGFHADADPRAIDINECTVCRLLSEKRVLDESRTYIARELGVDESEVF